MRGESVGHEEAQVRFQLGQREEEQVLHGDEDVVGVGRGRRLQGFRGCEFLGHDRRRLEEEGLATVRGEAVLDEVEEATAGQSSRSRRACRHVLSTELLEQILELVGRRELDQALQQA